MRQSGNRLIRILILVTGAIVIALYAVFGSLRHVAKKDHDAAVPHEATAIVTLIGPPIEEMDRPVTHQVLVQFQGQSRAAREVLSPERLQKGQPAGIVYRIGASGKVYIDSVRPLTNVPLAPANPADLSTNHAVSGSALPNPPAGHGQAEGPKRTGEPQN